MLKSILTLITVTIFLAACGATTPAATHGGSGHSMPEMAGDAPFDAAFIDGMIVHHQGAIDMAKQVQQTASHPEITAMAEAITRTQQAEIEQMTAWRKSWYPDLVVTTGLEMDMGPMSLADDPGKPVDRRFLEAMIPHHQGAIEMANAALAQAEHQELKQMAQAIIQTQQAEINQMEQWLADWYPR
jgi:uncharacterized protein (DUF305 family)